MVNTFSLSEIGVLLPRPGPCNHQWSDEKRFLYTIYIPIYIHFKAFNSFSELLPIIKYRSKLKIQRIIG